METQEQILKEQRLKIETLRYRILLRYYELLLTLDIMTQPTSENIDGVYQHTRTLRQKYETKPVKKEIGKAKKSISTKYR